MRQVHLTYALAAAVLLLYYEDARVVVERQRATWRDQRRQERRVRANLEALSGTGRSSKALRPPRPPPPRPRARPPAPKPDGALPFPKHDFRQELSSGLQPVPPGAAALGGAQSGPNSTSTSARPGLPSLPPVTHAPIQFTKPSQADRCWYGDRHLEHRHLEAATGDDGPSFPHRRLEAVTGGLVPCFGLRWVFPSVVRGRLCGLTETERAAAAEAAGSAEAVERAERAAAREAAWARLRPKVTNRSCYDIKAALVAAVAEAPPLPTLPVPAALLPQAAAAAARRAAATIHVSWANGDDAAAGTETAPLATAHAAQARARAAGAPVDVVLAAGRYELPAPLAFGAADAGQTWRSAPGGGPARLSGGTRLAGWSLLKPLSTGLGLYRAPAPAALTAADRSCRQLYVGGVRMARMRLPSDQGSHMFAGHACSGLVPGRSKAAVAMCRAELGYRDVDGNASHSTFDRVGATSASHMGHKNGGTAKGGDLQGEATAWWQSPDRKGAAGYVFINSAGAGAWLASGAVRNGIEFVYSGVGSSWSESRCAVASVTCMEGDCKKPPGKKGTKKTGRRALRKRKRGGDEFVIEEDPKAGRSRNRDVSDVPEASPAKGRYGVRMEEPCWSNLNGKPNGQGARYSPPTAVENVWVEALARDGSWYYDRTAEEPYFLLALSDDRGAALLAGALDVVAPVLDEIVASSAPEDAIRDVAFEGIVFEHGAYDDPGGGQGYVEMQSSALLRDSPPEAAWSNAPEPGAFQERPPRISFPGERWPSGWSGNVLWAQAKCNLPLRGAQNVRFDRCTFRHLGGCGVALTGGAAGNVVENSAFVDISGTAVVVGSFDEWRQGGRSRDRNNAVRGSVVDTVGVDYRGSCGVTVGFAADTAVEKVTVRNVPWSGVCVGWGWKRWYDTRVWGDPVPVSPMANNTVLGCKITAFKEALGDGGGIYTLGPQPGSRAAYNVVEDMAVVHNTGGGALYPDSGSRYWVFDRNVINRVCEEAECNWLRVHEETIEDVLAVNNYATKSPFLLKYDKFRVGGYDVGLDLYAPEPRVLVAGNHEISADDAAAWPQAAREIYAAAGAGPGPWTGLRNADLSAPGGRATKPGFVDAGE